MRRGLVPILFPWLILRSSAFRSLHLISHLGRLDLHLIAAKRSPPLEDLLRRGRIHVGMTSLVPDPRAKLQLHFDINQTILLSDPAVGVGTVAGLNIAIAKAAYVKRKDGAPLQRGGKDGKPPPATALLWHDGTSVDAADRSMAETEDGPLQVPALIRHVARVTTTLITPPSVKFVGMIPEDCISCYDLYGRDFCCTFTNEGLGTIFSDVFTDILAQLKWPSDVPVVPDLVTVEEGQTYHLIVPSFFNMLMHLKLDGRRFNVVLRTMGGDLLPVSRAIDAFCDEKHYMFTEMIRVVSMTDVKCKNEIHWKMERTAEDQGGDVVLRSGHAGIADVEGGKAIDDFFRTVEHTIGVRDDYLHWKAHNFKPASGKPMWLTISDFRVHPIFFDDNIHYDEDDSIVAVNLRATGQDTFNALSGEVTLRLHQVSLAKADVIQALLDPCYWLDAIRQCESNMQRVRGAPTYFDVI